MIEIMIKDLLGVDTMVKLDDKNRSIIYNGEVIKFGKYKDFEGLFDNILYELRKRIRRDKIKRLNSL